MGRDKAGFIFSVDSTIALLTIAASAAMVFYLLAALKQPRIEELLILQKEHDLMKHWLLQSPFEQEMIEQAEKLFGKNFSLEIDGKNFFANSNSDFKNSISSKLLLIDRDLKVQEIVLTVYD